MGPQPKAWPQMYTQMTCRCQLAISAFFLKHLQLTRSTAPSAVMTGNREADMRLIEARTGHRLVSKHHRKAMPGKPIMMAMRWMPAYIKRLSLLHIVHGQKQTQQLLQRDPYFKGKSFMLCWQVQGASRQLGIRNQTETWEGSTAPCRKPSTQLARFTGKDRENTVQFTILQWRCFQECKRHTTMTPMETLEGSTAPCC